MIKICLWASTQENNIGVINYGTEEENMFKVCDIVEGLLNKYKRFKIFRNETTWRLQDNVAQEHKVKPDIVVEVHSNAGGGTGAEVYCNHENDEGLELSQFIYNHVSALTPSKDRGIKDGMKFYDIRKTYATAVLVELFFHDNPEDVYHYQNNVIEYAIAIEKGICDFYEIPFRVYDREEQPKTIKEEMIDIRSKLDVLIERM